MPPQTPLRLFLPLSPSRPLPRLRPRTPIRQATNSIRPAPRPRKPGDPPPSPAAASPTTSGPSTDAASPPAPPPPTAQEARTLLTSQWTPLSGRAKAALPFLAALVLGLGIGAYTTRTWLAEPPDPGTAEDLAALARLEAGIDRLFITKVYRGKCVAAGRAIRGEGAGSWREIEGSLSSSSSSGGAGDGGVGRVRAAELRFESEKRAHAAQVAEREREIVASGGVQGEVNLGNKGGGEERLEGLRQQAEALGLKLDLGDESQGQDNGRFGGAMMEQALGGSRGLAVQRLFWNKDQGELVAVVYIGRGLCGWPNTVHGGFIATLMGERLGMAADLFRTEVLPGGGDNGPDCDWRDMSDLEVRYRKPTYAGQFYLARARPRLRDDRKAIEVQGTLETMEGVVTVEVNGTVALSKDKGRADHITTSVDRPSWLRWLGWK